MLRVVIIKPSKYGVTGYVERFRRGFMPNSTVSVTFFAHDSPIAFWSSLKLPADWGEVPVVFVKPCDLRVEKAGPGSR